MQPITKPFLAILILCTLCTASFVASQAREPVTHVGSPSILSSDTNPDAAGRPSAWRVECRKKDMQRKCRLISQCDNAGTMISLSPECEAKCLCVVGSSRYSMQAGMAESNWGLPNHGAVGFQKEMRARHKKEKINNEAIRRTD
jgi:hypothetical protein